MQDKIKKILVINGPNMNLLGSREPGIYGSDTLESINVKMKKKAGETGLDIEFFQSNHEGDIVDRIGQTDAGGIIINPAAFTHTSIAIRDSLSAFKGRIVEVHLSNIFAREEFRHRSLTAAAAEGVVCGFGAASYMLAMDVLTGS
ncbi:MAG: type II 3-dehydroquinate dehydratase [Elusimicrobia bacterium]|nr:type II 3-dehydroquinate dehydratase [Elusimicrobiota bacterium]